MVDFNLISEAPGHSDGSRTLAAIMCPLDEFGLWIDKDFVTCYNAK